MKFMLLRVYLLRCLNLTAFSFFNEFVVVLKHDTNKISDSLLESIMLINLNSNSYILVSNRL